MTLTEQLVSLIRHKPIAQADFEAAALFTLDTLACAIAARDTPAAKMLRTVAKPQTGDVARRAFYLGGISHILEMDDLHRDSVTHPGCVVVPSALMVAEVRGLSGHAFLRSVLQGYEAMCRIGNSVGRAHYKVWHNTSTCGPFGSAFVTSALLGLSDQQTVWALGNAGTQSAGLWEFLSAGAMSKHLHTARAAESGILAAELAAEGFTGAPTILEGEKGFYAGLCADPNPPAVLESPDAPWQLLRTSIKPWPCCRHTHPAIDAALNLHQAIGGEAISIVRIGAYKAALDVCDRPNPQDPYSAKFSLQHTVAAALFEGRVTQESFDTEARERLKAARAKVFVALSPRIDQAYPEHWGVDLEVELVNGQVLECSRKDAKGDPENPLSPSEIAAKAQHMLEESGMTAGDAKALIASILALVDDRPVRGLVSL